MQNVASAQANARFRLQRPSPPCQVRPPRKETQGSAYSTLARHAKYGIHAGKRKVPSTALWPSMQSVAPAQGNARVPLRHSSPPCNVWPCGGIYARFRLQHSSPPCKVWPPRRETQGAVCIRNHSSPPCKVWHPRRETQGSVDSTLAPHAKCASPPRKEAQGSV